MEGLHEFSEDEVSTLTSAFPGLKLINKHAIEGTLSFYKEDRDYRIQDSYEIGIVAPKEYPLKIPLLFERGGRTQRIAEKHGLKDIRDLHYNTGTKSACLCVKQEERMRFPEGSNLVDFINNLAIPYLYGLSYFDEQGMWPWGERSHGVLGLLEFYAENPARITKEDIEDTAESFRSDLNWKEYSRQLQKPMANRPCTCGSKKLFSECHTKAWKGLILLGGELKNLKMNVYKLYRRKK